MSACAKSPRVRLAHGEQAVSRRALEQARLAENDEAVSRRALEQARLAENDEAKSRRALEQARLAESSFLRASCISLYLLVGFRFWGLAPKPHAGGTSPYEPPMACWGGWVCVRDLSLAGRASHLRHALSTRGQLRCA